MASRTSGATAVRQVPAEEITAAVAALCQEANYELGPDVIAALERALQQEESPTGRDVIRQLIENARIAREERVPVCQDTGTAVVFVELGQDVHVTGGDLCQAINEGVRRGYAEGYLRKSMVGNPLRRVNTGDNTPAIIHTEVVPGDRVRIAVAPKGGGSENMSRFKMLTPADGERGVKDFVLECVREAGSNPCPPVVVGIGLGGNFEKSALLSKKALLRPIGTHHPDAGVARLEAELLTEINDLGIGPQGFGGRVTALWVSIETYATHITSLPVSVNFNCVASRHREAVL